MLVVERGQAKTLLPLDHHMESDEKVERKGVVFEFFSYHTTPRFSAVLWVLAGKPEERKRA